MEKLWAPWRIEYIRSTKKGCFFCAALKAKDLSRVFVLERSDRAFTIMNRFPYNSGHLMIAPIRHTGTFEHLDNEEILEMHRLLNRSLEAMKSIFQPQGFNIGVNLGEVAGAGVVGHVHMHVVPRWQGDTNYMPILADTKVVIESLNNTYDLLKNALNKIDNLQ
ncbi:HIT domain-containing protein [candidate division WOR-3 bacterium]|nr:HIT domain-containing protein [candidate division WOR-3 bacterium]